jgi:DNA invertase Pin-like site-specific DNA recombinase
MKAIGYIRWSSDEQTSGDSLERQTAHIAAYCEQTGLELTEILIDEGLSGFKGEHLSRGKLGAFLAKADAGLYGGQALVVEQLDRLSRLGISETGDLLKRILRAGLEIHVTQTRRVIRSLDDITTALLNVLESWSAEQYSAKLKERVTSAWRNKRKNAKDGEAITKNLPAWLKSDGAGCAIQIDEAKAEVVREIFRLAAAGNGKRMICRILTERGIPAITGGAKWDHSYVGRILLSRTVLGERCSLLASRNGDGEVRTNYYPAIVSPELWQAAQAAIGLRRGTTDNGTVTGRFQGRSGKVMNLFKGLISDVTTGESVPMYLQDMGNGRAIRLSTEKTSADDKPRWFDYALFEGWFLTFLDQIDWTSVLGESDSEELRQADETVARFGLDIERGEQRKQRIINLLIDTPSQGLKDELLNTEAKIEKAKADKATAEQRLEELKRRHADLLDKSVVYGKLVESRDLGTRARLREEIRRKVSRINFAFHQPGMERNDTTLVAVKFVNGVTMVLVFLAGGVVMAGPYGDPDKWVALKGDKVLRYTPEDQAAIKRAVIRELSKEPRE